MIPANKVQLTALVLIQTLWSSWVHVGQHRMRTWSSTWRLGGLKMTRLALCYRHMFCIMSVFCVPSTWLPILMGGPLGPPAKRGDIKDWDGNKKKKITSHYLYIKNVPKIKYHSACLTARFVATGGSAKALSWDECQSMTHQHWETQFPNDCR